MLAKKQITRPKRIPLACGLVDTGVLTRISGTFDFIFPQPPEDEKKQKTIDAREVRRFCAVASYARQERLLYPYATCGKQLRPPPTVPPADNIASAFETNASQIRKNLSLRRCRLNYEILSSDMSPSRYLLPPVMVLWLICPAVLTFVPMFPT